jgi:lipoprotein-releasing system ATP-binding protein
MEAIAKTFRQGGKTIDVLHEVSLEVRPGELVALVGPSGAGKSTLLHIGGLLERADAGEVVIGGQAASTLDDNARTALRRNTIGFVYQYHHLLPEFSALENVVLPQMIAGLAKAEARARGAELLRMVGLSERAEHRPAQLSGGEQQRVAIARGLANAPAILFADEPTGNLDPHTAESVFDLLVKLVRGAGLAALIGTHNLDLAARMDRTLRLEDGHIA